MPRHRKERVPLYRTRLSAVHAARRVPLRAAFHAPAPDAGPGSAPSDPPITGSTATSAWTTEQLLAGSVLTGSVPADSTAGPSTAEVLTAGPSTAELPTVDEAADASAT